MDAVKTCVLVHSPLVGPVTWIPVADALAARGIDAVLAELHDPGPPYWMAHAESVAGPLRASGVDTPLILVAHSGAGALLPAIRRALDSREVAGYVFVDAGLPAGERSRLQAFAAEAPAAAAELEAHLRAGGRFPEWTDEDLAPLVPDDTLRAALIRSLRPRGLDYWTEQIPAFPGWPDAPCGYVRLSESYRPHAEFLRARGRPVFEFDGAGHFHAMVDPDAVAGAIVAVSGA